MSTQETILEPSRKEIDNLNENNVWLKHLEDQKIDHLTTKPIKSKWRGRKYISKRQIRGIKGVTNE